MADQRSVTLVVVKDGAEYVRPDGVAGGVVSGGVVTVISGEIPEKL
jgi:hypothetical protein